MRYPRPAWPQARETDGVEEHVRALHQPIESGADERRDEAHVALVIEPRSRKGGLQPRDQRLPRSPGVQLEEHEPARAQSARDCGIDVVVPGRVLERSAGTQKQRRAGFDSRLSRIRIERLDAVRLVAAAEI